MAKKGEHTEMDMKKLSSEVNGTKHHYPSTLNLDEGDLKEVKNWKVGKTYKILLTVKETSSSIDGMSVPYDDSDKDKVHARFEVLKAEAYTE